MEGNVPNNRASLAVEGEAETGEIKCSCRKRRSRDGGRIRTIIAYEEEKVLTQLEVSFRIFIPDTAVRFMNNILCSMRIGNPLVIQK